MNAKQDATDVKVVPRWAFVLAVTGVVTIFTPTCLMLLGVTISTVQSQMARMEQLTNRVTVLEGANSHNADSMILLRTSMKEELGGIRSELKELNQRFISKFEKGP